MVNDINEIIKFALENMRGRLPAYTKYQDYYDGRHELAFATDKFRSAFDYLFKELAINFCPAVVQAFKDRLKVKRFDVEEGQEPIGEKAWEIWNRNRMDKRAKEVHQEALTRGDAFVLVWPGEDGKAVIYPQSADSFVVHYDDENPFVVSWAVKLFVTFDKHLRLNIYLPDGLYKFITKDQVFGLLPSDASAFQVYPDEPFVPNPYGVVPVFHFANQGRTGKYGKSELHDVKPVQDALNKTVADMLVGMEFVALPQRYVTGLQVEIDEVTGKPKPPFEPGVDRIWAVESDEVKFGEFAQAQLAPFIEVKTDFVLDLARITGIPLHYLLLGSGQFPSGDALQVAEAKFANRIEDMQQAFGNVWEDVLKFALLVEGVKGNVQLRAEWFEASPVSKLERYTAFKMKRDALSLPAEQLQREDGYTDQEIEEFTKLREAEMKRMQQFGPQGAMGAPGSGKTEATDNKNAAKDKKDAPNVKKAA